MRGTDARRARPARSTGWIAGSFILSALASIALAIVYLGGGQPQLEGALLGAALGGLACGFVLLAKRFLPHGPFVQEREVTFTSDVEADAEEAAAEGAEELGRRRFIARLIVLAFGTLGIASLFPIRSLGTQPGRHLFKTAWANGLRIVTGDGRQLRPDDLPVNGVLTVFPEGHPDSADAQSLLIRLAVDDAIPRPDSAYEQLVVFSKVCTHAGCPVGLYQAETRELFCPCHQSVFDVLQGAAPTAGPATRPLPQLPIGVDAEGYLIALGDFPEPIGPGYWDRGRDQRARARAARNDRA